MFASGNKLNQCCCYCTQYLLCRCQFTVENVTSPDKSNQDSVIDRNIYSIPTGKIDGKLHSGYFMETQKLSDTKYFILNLILSTKEFLF